MTNRPQPEHIDYAQLEKDAALAVDFLIHNTEHSIMEICNANMRMTKALLEIVGRLNWARDTRERDAARDVAIKCLQININLSRAVREGHEVSQTP